MPDSIRPSLAGFFAGTNSKPPMRLGTRYDTSGNFLTEPGNTVVSHLVSGSPSEAVVLAVRNRMLAMPDADRLAFTPVSSLHVTLFQGIIEYRRRLPYWPRDVPLDTSIDAMTRLYLERLKGFQGAGPFKIKVVEIVPTGLTVAGATDETCASCVNGAMRSRCRSDIGIPIMTPMSSTSPSPTRSSALPTTGQPHGKICSMIVWHFLDGRRR